MIPCRLIMMERMLMVCKKCNGTGGISTMINAAPYGSGHYWPMEDGEPCPDCVEKEICPKCDIQMDLNQIDYTLKCPKCGYNSGVGF